MRIEELVESCSVMPLLQIKQCLVKEVKKLTDNQDSLVAED
jgi:hypothetical protein